MAPNSSSSRGEDESRLLMAGGGMAPPAPTKKSKHKKPGKVRALSTERSRQCRERQKLYSENFERVVRALRAEVCDLQMLRNLRREQSLQQRGSVSGSLAKIVREYMTVFRHGMPSPAVEAATTAGKKRSLASSPAADYQPSPDAQREFLTSIMDPYVEVFDWCGRFVLGAGMLLNGWKAWAEWHDSLDFELVDIGVVDTEETLAVTTRANLRVRVSHKTIEHLFPHVIGNKALYDRMLGQEICYPMRDTFYFASNKRVIKYVCDIDFTNALLPVAGDYETVLFLLSPPNQASLNDLAVRTSPSELTERSRLDVGFLLSDE
jgi:hypothetical protein